MHMKSNLNTYQSFILALKNEKKEKIEELKSKHCEDDADLVKIEVNIIEIFEKMISVSLKKSSENFKEAYLEYFDKIPASWYENLKKCEDYGEIIEAHKEKIKIKQAELLKEKFLELYVEVSNEK